MDYQIRDSYILDGTPIFDKGGVLDSCFQNLSEKPAINLFALILCFQLICASFGKHFGLAIIV